MAEGGSSTTERGRLLNYNVGVLGHVDSGKTSLAKALSTVASTAAFDKNPDSQERGITLDLGFSSFVVPLPDHLKDQPYDNLQLTLVDCPGHASLIKTIIGGAQIIDLMMLVVDITKGMQTQTAECLVIGEIACRRMLVVLNKIDLVPEAKRQAAIDKMSRKISKTLESTHLAVAKIIAVAAKPGGPEAPPTDALGVASLIEALSNLASVPERKASGDMLLSVDHCFPIRGQGTVMTGTLLRGTLAVGDMVEISAQRETRKVKSMQMFRNPVQKAIQGDRLGVCVTQFDPKQLERGLVCSPGSLPTIYGAIVAVRKIPYFKADVKTKAKFHIIIGHENVMGRVSFFSPPAETEAGAATTDVSGGGGGGGSDGAAASAAAGIAGDMARLGLDDLEFDFDREYVYQDELLAAQRGDAKTAGSATAAAATSASESRSGGQGPIQAVPSPNEQWMLVEFDHPVICPHRSLVIGARLDTDHHSNSCRLAFHGRLVKSFTDKTYAGTVLPRLKIFKTKFREGFVDRMSDEYTVIGKQLFKKASNIQRFINMKVTLETGEAGILEGGFGQSGKYKVRIPGGLKEETVQVLAGKKKSKGKGAAAAAAAAESGAGAAASGPGASVKITLAFKRYVHDPNKRMVQ